MEKSKIVNVGPWVLQWLFPKTKIDFHIFFQKELLKKVHRALSDCEIALSCLAWSQDLIFPKHVLSPNSFPMGY